MVPKLPLLAAFAVTALAMPTSSALATGPVHVEHGEHVTLNGNQTLTLLAHTPMGTAASSFRCDNDWEGHITEDGDVELERVDFAATPGSIGNCDTTLNDCSDAGWHGQIEETAPGVTHVLLSYCLTGTGLGATPISGDIACALTKTEMHCDDVTFANQFPPAGAGGVVRRFEMDGEINIDGESELVITHQAA